MKDKVILDPLKSLDQICEPDSRQKYFYAGLQDYHSELSGIVLNSNVPVDVHQLFETAKNLSLYSWFVYRFHQVAELVAFSALEMALRERFLAENHESQEQKKYLGLSNLLQHAKSVQWITNDGFPSLYVRAKHLAEYKKSIEIIKNHDFENKPTTAIEEPSEKEILSALKDLDMVDAITSNANKIRNDLAHGSNTLHSHSISTLVITAEVINQIYP